MAGVLTTSSNVTCGHVPPSPGRVSTSSDAKLTVNGRPVLLKDGIDLQSVNGCGTPPLADSQKVVHGAACTQVTATATLPTGSPAAPQAASGVSAGEATKLTAGRKPVVLDTLSGTTNGMVADVSPQPTLSATAQQNKLTAV